MPTACEQVAATNASSAAIHSSGAFSARRPWPPALPSILCRVEPHQQPTGLVCGPAIDISHPPSSRLRPHHADVIIKLRTSQKAMSRYYDVTIRKGEQTQCRNGIHVAPVPEPRRSWHPTNSKRRSSVRFRWFPSVQSAKGASLDAALAVCRLNAENE